MKNKLKNIFSVILLNIILTMSLAVVVLPASASMMWGNNQDDVKDEIGLENRDPRLVVASITRFALGFLGIIAVIIVMYGGLKWMTAGGNDDNIKEAKKILKNGVIGLVIILTGWGIAQFTVNILLSAT